MRQAVKLLVCAALLCFIGGTGQADNQALSRQDVIDNVAAGNFTWSSGQPGGWAGSTQIVSRSEFVGAVTTSGSCGGSTGSYIPVFSDMISCAVNASQHAPIILNNSFAGPSFTHWSVGSSSYSGCSSGENTFGASSALGGEDDNAAAVGGSGTNCVGVANVLITFNQSFTISGTPTGQSYSFYYSAPPVTAGIPTCTQGTGNVLSIVAKISGTTIATISSPIINGNWVHAHGTMTALSNGSNTLTFNVTVSGAAGTAGFSCAVPSNTSQPIGIDNISLKATY